MTLKSPLQLRAFFFKLFRSHIIKPHHSQYAFLARSHINNIPHLLNGGGNLSFGFLSNFINTPSELYIIRLINLFTNRCNGISMSAKSDSIPLKKLLILGSLIIILQMCIYSLLWMNPWVKDLTQSFNQHASVKPFEYFGGVNNWMIIRTLYHIIFHALFIALFIRFYHCIPGYHWKKGLYFSLFVCAIKTIPEAFNKWTLIAYPETLIILQLINNVIGLVIFGIILAICVEKFSIITLQNKTVKPL